MRVMTIDIVPATTHHANELSSRLRDQDMEEVAASSGLDPLSSLVKSVEASELCWTALLNDHPEIIWGVAELTPEVGGVWLLGSDRILEIPRRFLIESARYVELMLDRYPTLTNYVSCQNTVSRSWLQRLGFAEVGEPFDLRRPDFPFIQFARTRHV